MRILWSGFESEDHSMPLAPVLILPGLYNSGPQHWQSLWEARNPDFQRVNQDDWEGPACSDWVARLAEAVSERPGAVLVTHSSSCALVAHWVAGGGDTSRVRAALLVAPSDPEAPSYPKEPTGFAPMPLVRLPFPTVVVASDDDPYVTLDRAKLFAGAWGSQFVPLSGAGHINSQSGLGNWPQGFQLLEGLRDATE
jgi:predicted alpha/beta hydrolase family esterase